MNEQSDKVEPGDPIRAEAWNRLVEQQQRLLQVPDVQGLAQTRFHDWGGARLDLPNNFALVRITLSDPSTTENAQPQYWNTGATPPAWADDAGQPTIRVEPYSTLVLTSGDFYLVYYDGTNDKWIPAGSVAVPASLTVASIDPRDGGEDVAATASNVTELDIDLASGLNLVVGKYVIVANPHGGSSGSGYVLGDTITLTGGTFAHAAKLAVVRLSGSAVLQVAILDVGSYSVVPANPVAQGTTSGAGVGATFDLTFSTGTNPQMLAQPARALHSGVVTLDDQQVMGAGSKLFQSSVTVNSSGSVGATGGKFFVGGGALETNSLVVDPTYPNVQIYCNPSWPMSANPGLVIGHGLSLWFISGGSIYWPNSTSSLGNNYIDVGVAADKQMTLSVESGDGRFGQIRLLTVADANQLGLTLAFSGSTIQPAFRIQAGVGLKSGNGATEDVTISGTTLHFVGGIYTGHS